MSALTSLLVRDQVVSVRKIEEAIQRQVVAGGDLESVLLEMDALPENAMSAYRAALFNLLPATRDEVMRVGRETIRLVPREVAEQYRMIPLHAEGRTLVVAVTAPLSAEDDQQLGFLLNYDLVYRVVTDVRIAAALSHHYGIEPAPRFKRLAERLRQRDAGRVPYVAPPDSVKLDRGVRDVPSKQPAAIDWDDDEGGPSTQRFPVVAETPPSARHDAPAASDHPASDHAAHASEPPRHRETTPGTGGPGSVPAARAASAPAFGSAAVASSPSVSDSAASAASTTSAASAASAGSAASTASDDPDTASVASSASTASDPGVLASVSAGTAAPEPRVLAEVARTAKGAPTAPEPSALAKKLRGPLPAKNAVALLSEARERDDLLEIFFVFARQFFDYAILFIVHEDIAEGREAYGDGKTSADVRQIAVPLDVPGSFALARSGLVPIVVDLRRAELDAIVAKDLDRANAQPALLVPIAIRKRVVLILYGDRGGERFELSDLPELIGFLPRMSEALEALIRRKKRDGYGAADTTSRGELKSSAAKIGAGAIAVDAARPSVVDDYRSSKPPTVELPRKASRPKQTAARREDPLGVLGVPRTAPPPPMTGEHVRLKDTQPDGHAAMSQSRMRAVPTAAEARVVDTEADVDTELDDMLGQGDDTPSAEVVIDYDDEEPARPRGAPPTRPGGEDALPAFARSQASKPLDGAYVMTSVDTEEVVPKSRPPKAQRADRTNRPSGRPPEREAAPASHRGVEQTTASDSAPAVETTAASTSTPAARVARRAPAQDMPSVIVDMGDTIETLVDDLVRSGPDDEGGAVQALLTMGEAALPAMVQRFPGPLWFDRRRPHRRLPRGRDVCALARAFVAFRERSVPYVVSLIESSDPDVRFYATLLAAELVSVDFVAPLGQRLFDSDPGVQLLAIDVLRHYSGFRKDIEELLKGVRVEARVDRKDPERRRAAIRALGGLRDARSLELLAELLGAKDRDIAAEAHSALTVLTRHDFGDTPRKWAPWIERNRDRHRIEWLIDALVDPIEDVRTAASEELKVLTQEYFGYHPAMPKRDREIAQRKYRDWWETEGERRFL